MKNAAPPRLLSQSMGFSKDPKEPKDQKTAKTTRQIAFLSQVLSIVHHGGIHYFFPQQRKLMGSSAQLSSGVCRCGSQHLPKSSRGFWRVLVQVLEAGSGEGSGRFRCLRAGSEIRFRKVSESSGRF